MIKNIYTFLFIAFLMFAAASLPGEAYPLLSNPIFTQDGVEIFQFDKNDIYKAEGFVLSNVNGADVLAAEPREEAFYLYDLYLGRK